MKGFFLMKDELYEGRREDESAGGAQVDFGVLQEDRHRAVRRR